MSCQKSAWKSFAFIDQRFLLCFSYQPVVDYIDKQFESYLQEELKIKRSLHNYHDSRVHACLYFISPSGHSLKSLDLVTMKKLDSKVRFVTSLQDFWMSVRYSVYYTHHHHLFNIYPVFDIKSGHSVYIVNKPL